MSSWLRSLIDLVVYPLRALLQAPNKLLSGSKRVWGLSLPARMALLVAIFLVLCVVVTLVAFYYTQDRSFFRAKVTPTFMLIIAALVVVIPIVLYKALKLWLEGDVSPFPDIDHAWQAGLAELQRHGLDLSQVPLFLVLGSAGQEQEKAIFDAARLSLNFREVPQGPAPLHWYGNADGIYLVCTGASCLSKLAAAARQVIEKENEQARTRPAAPLPEPADSLRGTIVAGGGGGGRQGITTSGPLPAAPQPQPAAASTIRGTMMIGNPAAAAAGFDVSNLGLSQERKVIKLDPQAATEQEQRIRYVCHLIRRARQPLCPINGILTLLPFALMERSMPEAIEIQRAVHRDLAVAVRVLMVRCPATAVVVGLEEEGGFRELVRRVGRDRAVGQRFGKGFSLGNPPAPERLEAFCAHACGAFEDWVYVLFREKGALSKPGNTKLYALLCKIRRTVQGRLADILSSGFGRDSEQDATAEAMLFGGCYFAAAGESEDRQAFVKGVFDKLLDQQEELQWTPAAYRQDAKYHQLAQVGLAADTLLLLGFLALLVHRWLHWW